MADPHASPLDVLAAQLDAVVASAPLGIGLFDLEVRHVRANPVLEQMNGLPERELLGRTPAELHGEVGRQAQELYAEVMRSGEPQRDVRLSGEVAARPGDVRHWSASFFPVRNDGQTIGLCVVVDDITEEHRLRDELERSDAQHRRLAEDLQRSLLPPVLPRLSGAEIATAYRPASGGATVGGDFYDLIRLSECSWAMVIGDVQGKGPVAASLTAAVRYAIRTATITDPAPAAVLDTVNAVLLREAHEDGLCTVAYVLAERVGDRISVRSCSAGHPLPLVVRAGSGAVETVGEPGLLLGLLPDAQFAEARAELGTGDALVLHTDGITEGRYTTAEGRVELFGDARLHASLRAAGGQSATVIAARIETAVLDFQAGETADDLALVVLLATDDGR